MEHFLVSARKYRPSTFESVAGQYHITRTLKNAIKDNQLAQAFLFCGPRGVGKTTCARILAKAINCQDLTSTIEPCGTCPSCVSFQKGTSFNIHELDAASNNSVEDIRSLIEQVRIPPQVGKYKVYIIDEAHMLSQAAFNAFLKTLEEPPGYAVFILATTEKHKILPTIISRCQIFDFNRIKIEDIAAYLASIASQEGIAYDQDALHLIAQKAEGGLRDALSMFDQIVSFSSRHLSYNAAAEQLNILGYDYYFKVTHSLLNEDLVQSLLIFDEVLSKGFDGNHFINGLASHFRNLLVSKDPATIKLLELSENVQQKYLQQAQKASNSFILSALNIANQCDLHYKVSNNQRLQVELALIKICHIPSAINIASKEADNPHAPESSQDTSLASSPEASGALTTKVEKVSNNKKYDAVSSQKLVKSHKSPSHTADVEYKIPTSENTQESNPVAKLEEKPIRSVIPNLNNLELTPVVEEKQSEYLHGKGHEPFTWEVLIEKWNQYAHNAKQANKLTLYTIMNATKPILRKDFKVEVTIENKIQENALNCEKIALINYLRTELSNFNIDIISKPAQEGDMPKKLYTAIEKYQHMAARNPQLEKLKKNFDLELD